MSSGGTTHDDIASPAGRPEARPVGRRTAPADESESFPTCRRVLRLLVCLVLVVTVATGPVVAQDDSNPVCADASGTLADMIEGFVQITTGLGIMGLLVVWQADALMEMFTLGREQKAKLKQHKRGAVRSALTLVVLGPLFAVGGTAMDLPIAQCVDLVPF